MANYYERAQVELAEAVDRELYTSNDHEERGFKLAVAQGYALLAIAEALRDLDRSRPEQPTRRPVDFSQEEIYKREDGKLGVRPRTDS